MHVVKINGRSNNSSNLILVDFFFMEVDEAISNGSIVLEFSVHVHR